MELSSLTAVSPVDGRYGDKVSALRGIFSEYGLLKFRVQVEVRWLQKLAAHAAIKEVPAFAADAIGYLDAIVANFSEEDAARIKTIERTTNHDVKAVEYFIKDEFKKLGIEKYGEFVHFGLTSQDINNTSVPLSLLEGIRDTYMPALDEVVGILEGFAKEWENVPMLAHTHGQPASPTRLGKEIYVYVARLKEQLRLLEQVPYSANHSGMP